MRWKTCGLGSRDEIQQPFILPALDPSNGGMDDDMQASAIYHWVSHEVLCILDCYLALQLRALSVLLGDDSGNHLASSGADCVF